MSESLSVPLGAQDSLLFARTIGSLGAHIEPGDFIEGVDEDGNDVIDGISDSQAASSEAVATPTDRNSDIEGTTAA